MSTRLIIKNIPKHLKEDRLREHFADKGEVTDVKIIRTPEGESRKFAFIGFRTENEAKVARSYFDRTYIDTSRILVDVAKPVADSGLERPWSKYSKGSSAFEKRSQKNGGEMKEKDENGTSNSREDGDDKGELGGVKKLHSMLNKPNEELQEFLSVMQPRQTKSVWSNDDGTLKGKSKKAFVKSKKMNGDGTLLEKTHLTFDDDNSDDDEYEDAPEKVLEDVKEGSDGGDESDEEEEGKGKEAFNEGISDMDYLRSFMKKSDDKDMKDGSDGENHEDEDEDDDEDDDEDENEEEEGGDNSPDGESQGKDDEMADIAPDGNDDDNSALADPAEGRGKKRKGSYEEEADIADTGRLFIRNLPFSATEDDLIALFKPFGALAEVHVPIDRETKRSKGFAYVLFVLPEHAVVAHQNLDGTIFQGRLMHILGAAMPKKKAETDEGDGKSKSYKKQKLEKLKANAGSEHNWNTLFMRSDAVVDALASKYSVKKSEILDRDADSMAVRVALGETHVIAETKKYLEDAGVNLDALGAHSDRKKERSKTAILAKNLPFNVEEEELQTLFSRFGQLGRLLLPPAKVTALIEFLEPTEARKAFRSLAYSNFHEQPLYLEWAPTNVFSKTRAEVKASTTADDLVGDDTNEEDGEGTVVFVKNLSFKTKEDALKKAFVRHYTIKSATIAKKKDPKSPGQHLSMGYGFVQFATRDEATKCVKNMQGTEIDGHAIQLKLSSRKTSEGENSASNKKRKTTVIGKETSKIVVRNVPFEATKKELRQLFQTFGQIKSLRIPKKFDGQHRGFAFIDYTTKQEAKNAFATLQSTHLYGRHLVLEYAKEEDSVEAIREKTTKNFAQ